MLASLLRWWRRTAPHAPLPPVRSKLASGPVPQPKAPVSPVVPSLKTAPFNPHKPRPAAVREYEDMRDRQFRMWNGEGLDGAIAAYRAVRAKENGTTLHNAYLRLLSDLADPTSSQRMDFYALTRGARPYLLGPYLGSLTGRAYPRLCWETSVPAKGSLTYVFAGGPADANAWRQRLPDICAWLGENWTIQSSGANTISLIRRAALPETIAFHTSVLKSGALYLGVDTETHCGSYLPFAEMTSGTFIPGASGTGKSNALHIIIQSLLANLSLFEAIYLIDGKDGVAFNRYRHAAPGKVRVLWAESEVWELTTALVALISKRNAEQRERNIDNATSHFIAVVIDEMATFTAKPSVDAKNPDNKRHAQFIDELTMLARRGRSAGFRLIISAQEPVAEQIPASVRANCLSTLAFRLPVDAHATAVFGQLDALPADPRRLLRGRALLKNGLSGDVRQVQFPIRRSP